MSLPLFVLQLAAAAAPAGEAPPLPTIEFQARVSARELTVEQAGEARLDVRAEPSLASDVTVTRNIPKGQQRYRNLDIRLDAQATIDPGAAPAPLAPGGGQGPALEETRPPGG